MSDQRLTRVIAGNGVEGYLLDPPGTVDPVRVRLDDGREFSVPASALHSDPNGDYRLEAGESVIPVLAEELVVGKRAVPTGGVRVSKRVDHHRETVDLPLIREKVDVRRVVIDRDVEDFLPVRRDGDTTIIPVVEEVLIVTKKLRLKEEIHITRHREEQRHVEDVDLERENVKVERLDERGAAIPVAPPPVDSRAAEGQTNLPGGTRSVLGETPRRVVRKNKILRDE